MTLMTHDTHDHNLERYRQKQAFSKRALFVLIFVSYLEHT